MACRTIFSLWHSRPSLPGTTGSTKFAVQFRWHPSMPNTLPDDHDDAICELRLMKCDNSDGPLFYDCRLLAVHLGLPRNSWTPSQLTRLMSAMTHCPNVAAMIDEGVLLRNHGHDRLTIDVQFVSQDVEPWNTHDYSCVKVVDVLNAFPVINSSRECAVGMLRNVAAIRDERCIEIQNSLERQKALRQSASDADGKWDAALATPMNHHRVSLQRFALVMQAKLDRERAISANMLECQGIMAKDECVVRAKLVSTKTLGIAGFDQADCRDGAKANDYVSTALPMRKRKRPRLTQLKRKPTTSTIGGTHQAPAEPITNQPCTDVVQEQCSDRTMKLFDPPSSSE